MKMEIMKISQSETPITITFSDVYLCNYPSFGIHSSHLDENGIGNRTGACDDDNLLTSFNNRWDTCNVQFNAISFINPVWLRITDEGSVPEMRIWSMSLIQSDSKMVYTS